MAKIPNSDSNMDARVQSPMNKMIRGQVQKGSLWHWLLFVLRRLLKVRLAGFGLVVLVTLILCALFADVIAPYNPLTQSYRDLRKPPSEAHIFGTDDLGRDVFSRLVFGSRVSLQVGIISVAVALVLGTTIGLLAGYSGGKTDEVLMRATDAISSFPPLVLALAITAALGMGIGNVMFAIGFVNIPVFARLIRAQVLSVREMEYVMAARAVGLKPLRLMIRHILPNVTAPIIVQSSLMVSHAIITEASLSFLGVGVRPPEPTWGSMLSTGYRYLETAPWLTIAPGLAIFITVLGLNLLGDGLRAALDPRLSRRGIA